MAEEEQTAEEGAEGAGDDAKGGGLKKILIIVVPLLLLVGGGAGAYFSGMLDSLLGKPAEEEVEGEHAAEGEGAKAAEHGKAAEGGHGGKEGEASGAFLPIPPIIVNLSSDDDTSRFLRLTVQLELEDPAERAAVEAVIPRVLDQFQTYLRELRVKDLRGSSGIYRLQMELLWRVNQAAYPSKIKDVLFQEILIQ